MRSRKPEARTFQKWVTSTVLPALRQTGVYVVGQEKVDLATMSYNQAAAHIEDLKAKVAEAEAVRWAKSREDKQDYRDAMKSFSRSTRRPSKKPAMTTKRITG
jgi:prophage antirepressor-like protein